MSTRADYAHRIRERLAQTTEAVIDIGKTLIEAKAALPHGEFEKMVRDDLNWSPRTAQRFMSIAEHPVLSNATHVSLLPASWGTLAELARVKPKRLQAALARGDIRPDMSRSEAKNIRKAVAMKRPVAAAAFEWICPKCGRNHVERLHHDLFKTGKSSAEALVFLEEAVAKLREQVLAGLGADPELLESSSPASPLN